MPKKNQPARQESRQEVRQEARQAAQSGNFSQANVQSMRDAGVRPQAIQNIREVARQAPAPSSSGMNIGYGVTNTGVPGAGMPSGTDPRTGQPIAESQASNIYKLNIPFSTAGVTNMWGNPLNNFDTGFSVVGDGVNWQDPKNASLLAQYTSPEAVNKFINDTYAMSSANPNRDANMAAFIDSGHAESLLTGRAPTAMPLNYTGLYNPATTGLNTPWSQQYAAANPGYSDAGSMGTAAGGVTAGSAGGGETGGAKATGKSSNLGQAIRGAGVGGINKSELSQIMKSSGKSGGSAIQRLDQINRSLKEKGKTGISLNSGAANMLISGAAKESPTGYEAYKRMLSGQSRFGPGRIGSTLQGKLGTEGSSPTRLLGGTSIRPGGREAVKGFGKQFGIPKTTTTPTPTTAGIPSAGSGTATAGGGMDETFTAPETTAATTEAPSAFGVGADLASWATGFRRKQSSRKGAGPRAQGLGSQRVAPTVKTLGY